MPTCPQGHQWEPPAAPPEETTFVQVPCPVCGAPVSAVPSTQVIENIETAIFNPRSDTEEAGPSPGETVATKAEDTANKGAPAATVHIPDLVPSGPEAGWPKIVGYEIVRELGRGGMGVVYQANHLKLHRLVALKMIVSGALADSEEMIRFRTEAEAIARLQHPNLVSIYEVGEQDGRPFVALEFVDGGDLDHRIDGKPQPPREAARMMAMLARAMHSAHQRGVVHRDLKPANVLLTADGTPKITDFGLAKCMDSSMGQTKTGAIMGTPSYMAPEQAAGRSKEIGPHTDVYALGAILYEFLTGRPPFLAETAWDTIVEVANLDPLPPSRLHPKLPRDLETICMKCLEKEPRKRYASAEALAEDLERYLAGEPIHARPVGPIGRMVKWVKRRPAVAALTFLSLSALLTLIGLGLAYHFNLQKLSDENHQRLIRLNVTSGVDRLDDEEEMSALVWFAEALRLDAGDPEREESHRRRIAAVLRQSPRLTQLWFHPAAVRHASFSPDGKRIVTACEDGTAQVWDTASGEPIGPALEHRGIVWQAWFSPDGKRVLTASEDGTARIWDAETGKPLTKPLQHGSPITYASFSPAGLRIITSGGDETARVWDVATGESLQPLLWHEKKIRFAAISPDQHFVVMINDHKTEKDGWDIRHIWDDGWDIRHVDGRWIVTTSDDNTARIWAAGKLQLLATLQAHEGPVLHAAFAPNGRSIVTASEDKTAILWRLADVGDPSKWEKFAVLKHDDTVKWAAFSPDGKYVLTASDDDTAKIWDAKTGEMLTPPLRHGSNVRRYAAFSPDSRWVVTAGDDNTARVWDVRTGRPAVPAMRHNGTVHCAAFASDGHRLVTASADDMAYLWDLATGSLFVSSTPADESKLARPQALLQSPDGRWKIETKNHSARILDTSTGKPISPPLEHASIVHHASFSPDGARVVTASGDNTACLWDPHTGEMLIPPLRHTGTVYQASFSPDGRWVATASADQTARVWNVRTGHPITPILKHSHEVREAFFSPDGRHVLTVDSKGTATTWELPRDDRPVDDLLKLSHLLAGSSINPKGEYVPLNAKMMKTDWQSLKGKFPEVSAPSEKEVQEWQRRK